MTPIEFFKDIGAQHNLQCSWGAIAPNGDVILCAWRHHAIPVSNDKDKWRVRVSGVNPHNLQAGIEECVQQIELVAKGAPGFLILCSRTDEVEEAQYASSFDKNYVYIVENVFRSGEHWYATIDSTNLGRLSVQSLRFRQAVKDNESKHDLLIYGRYL